MTPSYAVLFKCHDWRAFERRQLDRLAQRARSADIFVLADKTKPGVAAIDHPAERTFYLDAGDARAIGLEHVHGAPVFWYSNDYPLHIFAQRYRHYQYYLMIEFDVVVNADLDSLIRNLQAKAIDFVGEPIRTPLAEWPWRDGCGGWYADADIRHWLTCISAFSNRAAHHLYRRRVAASARLRGGEVESLPMCEAVVPTELHLAGFHLVPLSQLGSAVHFSTAPYYPEERLAAFAQEDFVHPVLDEDRFLERMFRAVPIAEEVLDHPPYRDILTDRLRAAAMPRIHHAAWSAGRTAVCQRVLEEMRRVPDSGYLRLHGLDGANIALGKPAAQSSVSEWSLRPDESGGPVTGPVTGCHTFHTQQEERPWWMVDLLSRQPVQTIRVFNRMDIPSRANGLEAYVSADGRQWDLAGTHQGEPFGGADGRPLSIPVNRAIRFVRLELPGVGILHLDQVQVLKPA
ncbi:MAG: hypothetical protein JSS43_16760 [Proteobacteria bacterium]|nr:hypothetical protein [Pseudomonadota bacterium]